MRIHAGMNSSIGRLARLAAVAVAIGVGAPASAEPPTLTGPGPPRLTPGTLSVNSPVNNAGAVFLRWEGTIAEPMAAQIEAAFEAFKSSRRRFVLVLNSGGGSVREGERVIALLQRIRTTHQLDTAVERGARCGSMCVPIYLQGQARFGARSSAWLFHEITLPGSFYGRQKKVEGGYTRLIEKYWIPAGVPRPWIDRMLKLSEGHDFWQTGDNLINDQAGIITRPIENRTRRNLEADSMMPAQAKAGVPDKSVAAPGPLPGQVAPGIPGASLPSATVRQNGPIEGGRLGGAGKRGAAEAAGPAETPVVK